MICTNLFAKTELDGTLRHNTNVASIIFSNVFRYPLIEDCNVVQCWKIAILLSYNSRKKKTKPFGNSGS